MSPTPIVLDCDPGHDDAIAILLALASPEIELTAITTVAGNQTLEKTTANALRILELAGRSDIPVFAGAAAPILRERDVAAHVHGESGLDGPELAPPSVAAQPEHAVEFLGRLYASTDKPVLVPTGPLTNVGLLFAAYPEARPERIVLMGGSIGEGNRTPAAEYRPPVVATSPGSAAAASSATTVRASAGVSGNGESSEVRSSSAETVGCTARVGSESWKSAARSAASWNSSRSSSIVRVLR